MNDNNGLEYNVVPSNIIYGSENIEQDNLILFSSTTEFFNTSCYLEVCSFIEEQFISFAELPHLDPVFTNSSLILSLEFNSSESTPSFFLSI